MSVIEVKELTKVFKIPKNEPGLGGAVKGLFCPQYENKTVVDGISFSVEAGEIVGYIGVNGAGKSTTIKMLTWIIPYGFASFYPTSYVLNRDVGNIAWLGPFVAALLLFLGYRFWQFGLKYYSGTGT